MKIYYFNDTGESQLVFVNDLSGTPKCLSSANGDYFEINLKHYQCPFIKVWETNSVLISSMDDDLADSQNK
jgi:hypothetical protein